MGKRLRLKPGDIFAFDLDPERCGVGQVIEPGGVFLATVLTPAYPKGFTLLDIDPTDILLTGWTMDGRLYHGIWKIVGNLPVPEDRIPRPCSKVTMRGETWLQDYRGNPRRPATDRESAGLDLHSSLAPMCFEDAFRAHHNLEQWNPAYDKITYDYRLRKAKICQV